jgi:hypothetical protein
VPSGGPAVGLTRAAPRAACGWLARTPVGQRRQARIGVRAPATIRPEAQLGFGRIVVSEKKKEAPNILVILV